MKQIEFPVKRVPKYVRDTANKLIVAGFSAYLVGGAVRDLLLERPTKDFDIATNALPDQTSSIFTKSIATGKKFGNIIVVAEDEYGEKFDVDVTTFRKEEDYYGGRWPGKVEFTSAIEEDLSRRDFTINAMAINMLEILNDEDQFLNLNKIIDPYNGIADILEGIVKAVGDPNERMNEDGLRAFRACRIASEISFILEENTKNAIKKRIDVAEKISKERIRDEIKKMIKHSPKPSIGFLLMEELGLLNQIMPELCENKGIEQPEWHIEDVFLHSLKTLDLAEDDIKFAALFHDIGKAKTKTQDEKGTHFYGHDKVGAEITQNIMTRLRFSNHEAEATANLVRWHMFYYPSADWRKQYNIDADLLDTNQFYGWTDSAIRRFIRKVGGPDQVEKLMKLRIADASANPKTLFNPKEIKILEERIAKVMSEDMALKVTDLDIDGNELMKLGIKPGPQIGQVLNYLLEEVTNNPGLNNKNDLLNVSIEYIKNKKL